MTYYCHHCGAILNNENDLCTSCGCKGISLPSDAENASEKQDFSTICPICHDVIPSGATHCRTCNYALRGAPEKPSTDQTAPSSRRETRRQRMLSNLTMLALGVLIVLLFLLMNAVTPK